MITGVLKNWQQQSLLRDNAVLQEAFDWIEKYAQGSELGFHELPISGCKVRIMEYALKDRDAANYEHHRHTIDLQVTLRGNEGIEWTPLHGLTNKGEYLPEKDFQFLETPERGSGFIENREGQFCILFPDDAHQPQRLTSNCSFVRKLVIKIPVKDYDC
ncbi:MAG: YhcH/YjgK/YiaL family protein [Bacteroidota bacterium]